MSIDWPAIGQVAGGVIAGAATAWGALRHWQATRASPKAPAPAVDVALLPAVLEALESGKEAADDAVAALRAMSMTQIESERSLATLIGALRGTVDRGEQIEGRLRKLAARLERAADRITEGRSPPGPTG